MNSDKVNLPAYFTTHAHGVTLAIKLQPRASKSEIGRVVGNELRVKVTAPPVDSAANEALIRLLAETLDCSKNQVELVHGQTSRHKLVKLLGIPAEVVMLKLSSSAPRRGE